MEIREAFERLGLSAEERRHFRTYTRNTLRRGFTEGCAVTVALHLLDVCDKQIARVLEKEPKAVSHCLARARRGPRPFERGSNGATTGAESFNGD